MTTALKRLAEVNITPRLRAPALRDKAAIIIFADD